MKRTIALLVTGLLLAAAAPAVGGENPVTVSPNPVKQNKKISIVATDCESGPDWEAFVAITIYDSEGNVVYDAYIPADDDGTTVQRVKMKKNKYPPGNYVIYVDCIHEFDEGGEGVWYETDHDLKVKKKKK